MDAEIETLTARLDDAAELTRFLASVPDSAELAKVLDDRRPVSTRAYEDETWTARFVESDGKTVVCFKIAPITIDQAEMIEMQWERNIALSETAFKRAVEQALGG
jgi:hypothetical protein